MATQKTTLLGAKVDGYVIHDLIGEGAFSWVHKGTDSTGQSKAFKVAKPVDQIGNFEAVMPSVAVAILTGAVMNIVPDTYTLLAAQARQIKAIGDSAFVSVERLFEEELCYYQMEFIDGQNLRQEMYGGSVPIEIFVELARHFKRLQGNAAFEYHGDLKPENVLLSQSGVKLLDTGFFGAMDCHEGHCPQAAITTPAYYPELEPNDLLAMGIMLWEVGCRKHPLWDGDSDKEVRQDMVGQDLFDWVRSCENVGQYYLSPMLNLERPALIRPEMPLAVEKVLLKSMQLKLESDGVIERDAGYSSFAELEIDLLDLLNQNITHI